MARGVEIYNGRVRIGFKWKEKRVYETTEFKPTPAGVALAGKLRAEILEKIKYGQFKYADYFPSSPRAGSDAASFYDLAKKYVTHMTNSKAASTVAGYRKCINNYWLPVFGETPIQSINTGDIRDAIAANQLDMLSPKTFNNAMTPLRGIFDLALDHEFVSVNPCTKIKAAKWQPPLPDPLDQDEMTAILKAMPSDWLPYFQVAFGTGARPSELIALDWHSVDTHKGLIRIKRAFVNGRFKQTKTHRARDVEINPLAAAGLRTQRERTFLEGDIVFQHRGKQIVSEKPPRLVWNAVIKKLGIRHRVAYATRETFISHALSAGVNINQVAQQCGNSPAIIMKHYGKWIPQHNSGMRELFSDSTSDSKRDSKTPRIGSNTGANVPSNPHRSV